MEKGNFTEILPKQTSFSKSQASIYGRNNPRKGRLAYLNRSVNLLFSGGKDDDVHCISKPEKPDTSSVTHSISMSRSIKGKSINYFLCSGPSHSSFSDDHN